MSIRKFWAASFIAALCASSLNLMAPAVAAGHSDSGSADRGVLLDRVVAVVNDDVILQSQLDQQSDIARQRLEQQHTPVPSSAMLRHQVLKQMISEQLQVQRAQRQGIHISDDTLNQALSSIAARNGFSLSDLPDKVAASGIDYKQFRHQIRRELILQKVRKQSVDDQISVTPAEVDQYLVAQAKAGHGNAQYHVYQILLKVPSDASESRARKIHEHAEAIYKKLKNGADFKATAAAVSEGQRALKGGDLGWLNGGEIPTSLANTVLTMNEGSISNPIKDANGYHIIKLGGKRAQHKIIVTQTHARRILIKSNLLVSNSEAVKRLEKLRERVKNGASFADLAKKYSDDSDTAADGGDLGWISPDEVPPNFKHAMDKLEPKDISLPFQSQAGWNIVQVLGRRKQNQTKESRRRKAISAIRQRKLREQTARWLRQLRDQAYVSIKLKNDSDDGTAD
jgi:peptidyl-prolyl cis-trans isomerase SurA